MSGSDKNSEESWSSWFQSRLGLSDSSSSTGPSYDAMTAVKTEDTVTDDFKDVDEGTKKELWSKLTEVFGKDVMDFRLSLPLFLFEPTTNLTRMCEVFEFYSLLDKAAKETDPVLRMAYVVAFVVSSFAHVVRTRKPFNPIIGETYVHAMPGQSPDPDFFFIAEQISHHPPLSVSHVQGRDWRAGEIADMVATYWGNSLDFKNVGKHFVVLESQSQELYNWTVPNSLLSNLFVGGMFIDHYGNGEIVCEKSKLKATMEFTQSGWFGSGRYEVSAKILDASDKVLAKMAGSWNKSLNFAKEGDEANSIELWNAGDHFIKDEPLQITEWTRKVLTVEEWMYKEYLPSDSRFRPDRLALSQGDTAKGSEEKNRVEDLQRKREKQGFEKNFVPKWFVKDDKEPSGYRYKGDYLSKVKSMTEEEKKELTYW